MDNKTYCDNWWAKLNEAQRTKIIEGDKAKQDKFWHDISFPEKYVLMDRWTPIFFPKPKEPNMIPINAEPLDLPDNGVLPNITPAPIVEAPKPAIPKVEPPKLVERPPMAEIPFVNAPANYAPDVMKMDAATEKKMEKEIAAYVEAAEKEDNVPIPAPAPKVEDAPKEPETPAEPEPAEKAPIATLGDKAQIKGAKMAQLRKWAKLLNVKTYGRKMTDIKAEIEAKWI